jgi:hypothetical protein
LTLAPKSIARTIAANDRRWPLFIVVHVNIRFCPLEDIDLRTINAAFGGEADSCGCASMSADRSRTRLGGARKSGWILNRDTNSRVYSADRRSNKDRPRRNRSTRKSVTVLSCGARRTSRRVSSHSSRVGGTSGRSHFDQVRLSSREVMRQQSNAESGARCRNERAVRAFADSANGGLIVTAGAIHCDLIIALSARHTTPAGLFGRPRWSLIHSRDGQPGKDQQPLAAISTLSRSDKNESRTIADA